LVPFIEVEGREIRRCERCGLGETVCPSPKESQASYDAAYLEKQWTGADPSPEQIEQAVRAELPRLRRVERAACGSRLLEVGPGHRYFLEAARRRGFEPRGIDVSSAAAELCASRFGIAVEVTSVEEATIPDSRLDVVVAWHVLEHLADPFAALRRVRCWLAPAGIIGVEVPNYESYDARQLGADWQGWQPTYHRWHFAPRTLDRMLRETGFTVERAWHSPSRIARERLKRIPVLGLFRRVLWQRYPGTGVAAIARR